MRLSVVSKTVSSSMLAFVIVAILVGIWGWNEINKPLDMVKSLQQYQSRLDVNVVINLERYLRTSDAALLNNAEIELASLKENVPEWLEQVHIEKLVSAITDVETNISEVRAAGKISANPQTLLENNERERGNEIYMLVNYVNESKIDEKSSYYTKLNHLSGKLLSLTLSRQRYFDKGETGLEQNIIDINQSMLPIIEELYQLPRLNLLTEVDEDALVPEEPEQKDLLSIDNLFSLTKRYEKELNNTADFLSRISESRTSLYSSISDLELLIEGYTSIIDAFKNSVSARVKAIMIGLVALLGLLVGLSFMLQKVTIAFLSIMTPYLESMSRGRFDDELTLHDRFEETASVSDSAQKLRNYLVDVIAQLQSQSSMLLDVSHSALSSARNADNLAREQLSATETVASAAEELSYSFKEVSSSATEAAASANDANAATASASEKISIASENTSRLANDILSMKQLMEKLENDSHQIERILDVIQDVAEQTNLLALNAAIEAARAGEQGRGFAVVADEVRLLAQRTADSTDEIHAMINQLVSVSKEANQTVQLHSNTASACVNDANAAFESIQPVVSAVALINERNASIATSTSQQLSVVEEIAMSIDHIKQHAVDVGNNIGVLKETARKLDHVSEALTETMEKLKA